MRSSLGQVLTMLDREGALARHRLADETGLTRATISTATQILLDRGLLLETERAKGSQRGGPRPILLMANPSALNVIGLDLRREKFTATLIDMSGKQIATASCPMAIGTDRETVLKAIDTMLVDLFAKATGPVAGLGIGSVGPVLVAEGMINSRHFPSLEGMRLVDYLRERFDLPVDLRIGAVAAAYGEEREALAQGLPARTVAFVVVDYAGIGIGLMSGGEGWITDHGGVGELGHVGIERNGRLCACGRRGCLLEYASGRAVLAALGREKNSDPGAQLARIARDAETGDASVRTALLEAGRALGYALADADRILRPERMVLASSHDRLADWYLAGARSYLETLPESGIGRPLRDRIYLSRMGTMAIACGAAAMQLKNVLAAPEAVLSKIAPARRDRPAAAPDVPAAFTTQG